ncbi:MAG: DUF4013 domain-containing protein [Methanocella sp.]
MDSNNSLSIFLHALIYPLTRMSAFFMGLLAGLTCFFFIGFLLVPGYVVRCGRHIMNGDFRLPTWDNAGDSLLNNGFSALCIILIYGIISYLISFAVRALLGWMPSVTIYDPYVAISIADCASFILTLPISMMAYLSLMIFIDRNDLGRALNPSNAFRLLLAKPIVFLKAAILVFVAANILSIPLTVTGIIVLAYRDQFLLFCPLALGFMALMMCQLFVILCVNIFIWASYYRMVIGSIEDEREANIPDR